MKKSFVDYIAEAEITVTEKAVSQAQQKFMGMVHAAQKGKKAASPEVAKVAKGMGKKDAKDFASTKHDGLPAHVKESVMNDHTGSTFDHICNTFKRDVADFKANGEMSGHLYDALYDYYFDDMPYGTKKARDGDPYEWVSDRFYQDLGIDESAFPSTTTNLPFASKLRPEEVPAFQRKAAGKDFPVTTAQVADTSNKLSDLSTLRRMAGLPDRI